MLSELPLSLRQLIRCLQSLFRDLCYIYFPQPRGAVLGAKENLYREINKSITLYHKEVHEKVKELLTNAIQRLLSCSRSPVQATMELKSYSTSYRCAVVYLGNGLFTALTQNSIVRELNDLNIIARTLVMDVSNSIGYESIRYIKALFPLNGDSLKVTYRCFFDSSTLEISILNVLYLLFYIGTVH